MMGIENLIGRGLPAGSSVLGSIEQSKARSAAAKLEAQKIYKDMELANLKLQQGEQGMEIERYEFDEYQKNAALREQTNAMEARKLKHQAILMEAEQDYMADNPDWYDKAKDMEYRTKEAEIIKANAQMKNAISGMTDADTAKYTKDNAIYGSSAYGAMQNINKFEAENPQVALEEWAKVYQMIEQRDPQYADTFTPPSPNMSPEAARRELGRLQTMSVAYQQQAKQTAIASRLNKRYDKVTRIDKQQVVSAARAISLDDEFTSMDDQTRGAVAQVVAERTNAIIDVTQQLTGKGTITEEQAREQAISEMKQFAKASGSFLGKFFNMDEFDLDGYRQFVRDKYNSAFSSEGEIIPVTRPDAGFSSPPLTPVGADAAKAFADQF